MTTLIRGLERLHDLIGAVAGLAIAVLIVTVVADVASRTLLRQPIGGSNEFSIALLVGLIFLGQAAAQRSKQNFTVDFLRRNLPPRARRVLEAATTLLTLSAVGLLACLTMLEAWSSFARREASFGVVAFPIWPTRILIAVGLSLLVLQLIIDLVRICGLIPEEPREEGHPHGAD